MIDLDITLLIQLFNFLLTLAVLNYLLIRPIRDIVKKRRDKVSTLLNDIDKVELVAETELSDYEEALRKIKANGVAERDAIKLSILNDEQNITQVALRDAQEYLRKNADQIKLEKQEALKVLQADVKNLATAFVNKVLV